MSYLLPQEVQTKKLASLPDDLHVHAVELIAKKFGIAEIVEKNSAFRPSSSEDIDLSRNILEINIYLGSGKMYRLMKMISFEIMDSNVFDNYIDSINRELCELAIRNNDFVERIEVEMNGKRDKTPTLRGLKNFITNHYINKGYYAY